VNLTELCMPWRHNLACIHGALESAKTETQTVGPTSAKSSGWAEGEGMLPVSCEPGNTPIHRETITLSSARLLPVFRAGKLANGIPVAWYSGLCSTNPGLRDRPVRRRASPDPHNKKGSNDARGISSTPVRLLHGEYA
jgi:hypothetical protein